MAGKLVEHIVNRLKIDLTGYSVLTEAANHIYAITPCISALANAKVFAYVTDTEYYKKAEAISNVTKLAKEIGVLSNISFVYEYNDILSSTDIITNSRPFRPFDKSKINKIKKGLLILLMYEGWELRNEEIDIETCKKRGVKVIGVNEHDKNMNVFNYVGDIAIKKILECGLPIQNTKVGVIGFGFFAETVSKILSNAGSITLEIKDNNTLKNKISMCDILIYADYHNIYLPEWIKLKEYIQDDLPLIQVVGMKNFEDLKNLPFKLIPNKNVGFQKMGFTFDVLGPRPIIELHALSFKAGELYLKGIKSTLYQEIC